MNKPMIEIYSPAIKEVKDYGLGESIDVTINGQAVIPILADKIYKSPFSAVRELYVNEVTAVKKALRINPNLKPEIHININTNTRELIIKGVDSLGIDTDTFKYILAVMGNSGNNNGSETGYYGLGFYSFVKLSERIIINSYSLETKEKWACIAKSALKFEKLPEGSYIPLDKTGFEITLSIKNELDITTIIYRIMEISKLSGVKTKLMVDEVNRVIPQYDNLMDYFKKSVLKNDVRYSTMYDHIDNDDFELIIGYTSNNIQLRESFLINVPIEIEYPRYDFPNICLLNVKDERKFKPSADRERFAEIDENNLLDKVNKFSFSYEDRLTDVKNLDEYYNSVYRFFYGYINNNISTTLRVKNFEEKDYRGNYEYKRLSEILPLEKPIEFRVSKARRSREFKELKEKNIFVVVPFHKSDYEDFIKIGFKDIDAGKTKKNRSNSDTLKLTKNFKFWNYYQNYDEKPHRAKYVIKVEDVRNNNLKNYFTTDLICFITDKANYFDSEFLIEVDDLKSKLDMNAILFTNKGFKTVSDILDIAYDHRHNIYYNDNDNSDSENRFMPFMYKPDQNGLIIKFDDSDNSQLLRCIIKRDRQISIIPKLNVDFDEIREKEEKIKYDEWKSTITDKRLRKLFDLDNHWHEENKESQEIISSLQGDLNK